MGFRCSLCCLVKGCGPTWVSGKDLAGGCAFSGTFRSAAKCQSQTPKWSLHLQILHAGGLKGKDLPQCAPSVWRGGCGTAFQLLRYPSNT